MTETTNTARQMDEAPRRSKSQKGQSQPPIVLEKARRKLRVSVETVTAALQELGIRVRYDQLLKEAEIDGLPDNYSTENASNTLPVYLGDYMRAEGYEGVTQQSIEAALSCIADLNRFNPVAEYLQSGKWDGQDRFGELFKILGVANARYITYFYKWALQTVALGMNDEAAPVGADGVLVFQGPQGIAKTSFFRILTPRRRWFVEGAILDMSNKDTLLTALRGWICELGELDNTTKKEQPALKAFLTRPEDRIRPPYARNDMRSPRRTSFCGTVNPERYLKDETGSRRFWTIPIVDIDREALFSLSSDWIDQFWYQVYFMYLENPAGYRLTAEEMEQLQEDNKAFETPLQFELEIMDVLDYGIAFDEWEWWTASQVARILPGVKAEARPVGKVLSKLAKNPPYAIHPNPPNPPKLEKTMHGLTHYLLPLRRESPPWVD